MRKWQIYTFLHFVQSSTSLLRNKQSMYVSRLKALARVGTTVIERSVVDDIVHGVWINTKVWMLMGSCRTGQTFEKVDGKGVDGCLVANEL